MKLDNDTLLTWRHVGILTILALVAAVAVYAITAAANGNTAGQETDDQPHTRTEATNETEEEPEARSEQVAPETPPADGVELPTGSTTTEGLPTGFPYTDLGAVAMQVHLTTTEGAFDYDQSARTARVYASPELAIDLDAAVHRAVSQRRTEAGLPADGEPVAPASYVITPMAFTVAELEPDLYAVTLLSIHSTTTVDGEVTHTWHTEVGLSDWVEGDWKAVTGEGLDLDLEQIAADHLHPARGPDSPEFAEVGWIPIKGAYQ